MAAELGSTGGPARFVAVEKAVREMQLMMADLATNVGNLTNAQAALSESVQTRMDALGGTVLGLGQNMDAHNQLLQSHDCLLYTSPSPRDS